MDDMAYETSNNTETICNCLGPRNGDPFCPCLMNKMAAHKWPEQRGGFEDIPQVERCNSPEHNPPSHICIPYGKQYRHICPDCKKEQVVKSLEVYC